MRAGPADLMLVAGGAVLHSSGDAWRAYGADLFASEEALRKALQRNGAISGGRPANQLALIRYKPHGRGQQWRTAHVAPDRLDGFGAWIGERLGKAVSVKVVQPAPAAEQPAALDEAPQPVEATAPLLRANLARWFGTDAAAACRILAELPDLPEAPVVEEAAVIEAEPAICPMPHVLAEMRAATQRMLAADAPDIELDPCSYVLAEEERKMAGDPRWLMPSMAPLPRISLAWGAAMLSPSRATPAAAANCYDGIGTFLHPAALCGA